MTTIDELLAESGQDKEETVTFTTELTGREWTARTINSSDEWEKLFRRAKHFENLTVQKTPPPYHPMLPISADTARGMAFMEAALLEPKLSILDMLILAKKRGAYFIQISTNLQAKLLGAKIEQEEDDTETLGEIFDATEDDANSSPSPAASGDSIPTSSLPAGDS